MPFKIAVTGGPATGKSTVLRRLARKGVPTFSADEVVRELTRPGTLVWVRIREVFGEEFFRPNGELDRRALLRRIVSDRKARERLEKILHPEVKKEFQAFLEASQGAPVVAAEIPLLFEVGWEDLFDLVMVVYVSEEVQKRRLLERLEDPHLVEAFLQLQWPLEEKCRRADLIVLGDDPS